MCDTRNVPALSAVLGLGHGGLKASVHLSRGASRHSTKAHGSQRGRGSALRQAQVGRVTEEGPSIFMVGRHLSSLPSLQYVSSLLGLQIALCLQSLQKHLRHRGTWEAMVLTWEMEDHPYACEGRGQSPPQTERKRGRKRSPEGWGAGRDGAPRGA